MKKISRLTALAGFSVITLTRAALIVALLLPAVPEAIAEVSPPAPRTITVERTFDKAAIPGDDIQIWKEESGGYDTENEGLYGRNIWLCTSSTDALHGKCATTSVWSSPTGLTIIPLTFIEKRSGMRVELNVEAYKLRGVTFPGCHFILEGEERALNDGVNAYIQGYCQTGDYQTTNETYLTAWLPASELKKIPVGGIWQADLHLTLTQ